MGRPHTMPGYHRLKDSPGKYRECARCGKLKSASHYSRPCAVRCIDCIALDASDMERGEAWCLFCRKLHPLSAFKASVLADKSRARWCNDALRGRARRAKSKNPIMRDRDVKPYKPRESSLDMVRRVEEKQRARGEWPTESVGGRAA